jgi:hypothetical protein
MSELGKVGQGFFQHGRIKLLAYVLGVPLILGFLGGSVLCAGLIHEDLAAVVFWLEFMSLPPLAIVIALVVGLRMRKAVSEPLDAALAPMLGPHKGAIGSLKWARVVDGRRYRASFYKYQLILQVDCQSTLDLRAGLDNKLAQWASKGWEKRSLPGGVVVMCKDLVALDTFLDLPAVPEAIVSLIRQDGQSLRSLYIKGSELGWVSKYMPTSEFTPEAGRTWLDAAELLAKAAEKQA